MQKSRNDGAEYCMMLKSGKTHLNICVLQMVLRYSDVGALVGKMFVRRPVNTALRYTSFRRCGLKCQGTVKGEGHAYFLSTLIKTSH